MNNRCDDLEPFEREWLAEAANEVESMRKSRSACPPVQLIRAASADALPEDMQSAVAAHISACRTCKILQSDLENIFPQQDLTPRQAERILNRVRRNTRGYAKFWPSRFFSWNAVLATAALALCAVLVWQINRQTQRLAPSAPAAAAQLAPHAVQIPDALKLEKPDVKLTLAALTWRGGDASRDRFLKDLAPALDSYRADDFASAASQFTSLSSKYAGSVEVFFYLGISRLFLENHPAAAAALENAARLDDGTFNADVAWYLGIAYYRLGRINEARTRFSALSSGSSAYAERARSALKALNDSAAEPSR